jgi:site-specific DNA-methyltransferase (adenine-specific)
MLKHAPGLVRDAIVQTLQHRGEPATITEILDGVREQLGEVAPSSVRSYLRLQTGVLFERRDRGLYELIGNGVTQVRLPEQASAVESADLDGLPEPFRFGRQTLYLDDCLRWLASAQSESVHAVVTDPPYGLVEYHPVHQRKLRAGRGGVWRIPPSFDGANRRPLPRFTTLDTDERKAIVTFFKRWGCVLLRVVRPGGHVVIAGNPLVSPLVAYAMEQAGFERRGEIVRLVRTFRGGDRPKGADKEFPDVSTMPRGCWEPWGLYRKPIGERTLAENLRKWGTGGLRRFSSDTPFLDVIPSGKTPDRERHLAPHPSVKPQAFLRLIVRGVLPVGDGVVLDPFAGCATTLAACEAQGVQGIGIEMDRHYWQMAQTAIPRLAALTA